MDKQFHGQAEARAGDLCKEPGITRHHPPAGSPSPAPPASAPLPRRGDHTPFPVLNEDDFEPIRSHQRGPAKRLRRPLDAQASRQWRSGTGLWFSRWCWTTTTAGVLWLAATAAYCGSVTTGPVPGRGTARRPGRPRPGPAQRGRHAVHPQPDPQRLRRPRHRPALRHSPAPHTPATARRAGPAQTTRPGPARKHSPPRSILRLPHLGRRRVCPLWRAPG
jgi:hypothetical protein